MSGKKNIKPAFGHGGKRPGAGRPIGSSRKNKITLELTPDLIETIETMAEKYGYTIDQFLLAIVYKDEEILPGAESIPLALRVQVAIQLKNFMKVSRQEIEISDKRQSPFNLPPLKEDPALKLVKGGKKAEDDLEELIPVDGGDDCE
jgi:hypothetical protein